MTTYAVFIQTLADIDVDGVVRKFDHVPNSVSAADLPALYVRLPGGGTNLETLTTAGRAGTGKTRRGEMVLLVEAAGLDLTSSNHDKVVEMLDCLEAAIDAVTIMPLYEYALETGPTTIGDSVYFSIIATITGTE